MGSSVWERNEKKGGGELEGLGGRPVLLVYVFGDDGGSTRMFTLGGERLILRLRQKKDLR